jgi:glycosyltransferase involved in cell wall biosynthesis
MRVLVIPHAQTLDSRGYFLAKHLAKIGDEVHFITWDPYPRDLMTIKENIISSLKYFTYLKDNVTVHKIRRMPFFAPPINANMFKHFVKYITKLYGLDIIISQSFINELEPPKDLPLIYDLVDHHEAYRDLYAGNIEKFGLNYILNLKKTVRNQVNHAKAVVAVSDILVDYASNINSKVKIYKISNGVDSSFLTHKLKTENYFGEYSMAYVSKFTFWSNLPKLLQAIKILSDNYPKIKLLLIGDGKPIQEAKSIVRKLGISTNVIFCGNVPRSNVPQLVLMCKIALIPVIKDLRSDSSSPITIMEYTALGKIIVSTDLEEVKSLKFPNIVFYNQSKDSNDLARAIMEALKKDILQTEIRELALKYSWDNIANEFHNIMIKIKT